MTVQQLREKYPVFEYLASSWKKEGDALTMEWTMRCGELIFNPKTVISGVSQNIDPHELDNLVFNLGMSDIFSYWKATCSKTIIISAGPLNEDQISFWHKLLIKGMGQYFYENQIDFKNNDFVNFVIAKSKAAKQSKMPSVTNSTNKNNAILIPVGGGKDSAVTLELLTKNSPGKKIGSFAMNLARSEKMQPSSKRLMDAAGVKEQIFVERILDPQIFDLKKQGFLDGHVPFSAHLAFLSILMARLFSYDSIAFSNERSSNESNLEFAGEKINHQYSKTTEFENEFRNYNSKYLSSVSFFSFLRPLYELQIMRIFSKMSSYFDLFRSCNRGYKTDSWCGSCAKCLATFVGLFPFVQANELVKIFGKNLFEDVSLIDLTKNVLGLGSGKPFECIGTFEETLVAFNLCLKKYDSQKLPVLLEFFQKEVLPLHSQIEKQIPKVLNSWDDQNNLPEDLKSILENAYDAS